MNLRYEDRDRVRLISATAFARSGALTIDSAAAAAPSWAAVGEGVERATVHARQDFTSIALEAVREADALAVHLDAASVDIGRWWDAERFGLAAEPAAAIEIALPEFEAAVACALTSEWWTEPTVVQRASDIPPKTQFLLWRDRDGRWGALVPLVGGDASAFMAGTAGGVTVALVTGEDGRQTLARAPVCVIATGDDPYTTIDRAYALALRASGAPARRRVDKPFPASLQRFGWCTWDAFYREVSAEGMRGQLQHLQTIGIPLGFLLVDDGWYEVKDNQLVDVEPDRARFPEGLAAFVCEAKQRFGVRSVGLWHALTGYWCGISAEHRLPPELARHMTTTKASVRVPGPDRTAAFGFYDAWHSALAAEGIDFLKVDGQGAIFRDGRNLLPGAQLGRDVSTGLQGSAGVHFGGQLLNCMSMRQELAWSWSHANVARTSNDYMIGGQESDASRHGVVNAYNALWIGQLTWCDWDMFRTDRPSAAYHAALRALSGGPIYISDAPGVTRTEPLLPLMLHDGEVLRPDDVGVPTRDCLVVDVAAARVPLKIANRVGDTAVIGCFHASPGPDPVAGALRPTDLPRIPDGDVAVWCRDLARGRRMRPDEAWPLSLPHGGHQTFVSAPIRAGFAPIGLVDKIIAPATIASWWDEGERVMVTMREGGMFVAYCAQRPTAVTIDGVATSFHHEDGWLRVPIEAGRRDAHVTIRR